MPEQQFVDSPADCIATAGGWIDKDDPKTYDIKRPVFMDLDHVAGEQRSGTRLAHLDTGLPLQPVRSAF